MPHPKGLPELGSLPSAQMPRASVMVTPHPASTGLAQRPGLPVRVNHCPEQRGQGGCKKLCRSQASFSFISRIPQALEHQANIWRGRVTWWPLGWGVAPRDTGRGGGLTPATLWAFSREFLGVCDPNA